MAFTATLNMQDSEAHIVLTGELDAGSAVEFRNVVEEAAKENPTRLILEMAELEFMASAGLRVLIFAKQKMGSDVDIYVVAPQEPVRETMEMTGFHYSVHLVEEYNAETA